MTTTLPESTIELDEPAPTPDQQQAFRAVERLRRTIIGSAVVVGVLIAAGAALVLLSWPKPGPLTEAQQACNVGMLAPDGTLVWDMQVERGDLVRLEAMSKDAALQLGCLIEKLHATSSARNEISAATIAAFNEGHLGTVGWGGVRVTVEPVTDEHVRFLFTYTG